MSNMRYCRFENTLPDLEECYENYRSFKREKATKYEVKAYDEMMLLIKEWAKELEDE